METEFSRRIAITGELAVGSSKSLFFKGKRRPTFKWLLMIREHHNGRWVTSPGLWHQAVSANFLLNLLLLLDVLSSFYSRFPIGSPYVLSDVSLLCFFCFFAPCRFPSLRFFIFQCLTLDFWTSVSLPAWLRSFLSSAEQIDEGHWLAVERQLMASKERWEIKKRMGVVKGNLINGFMTDWAEI